MVIRGESTRIVGLNIQDVNDDLTGGPVPQGRAPVLGELAHPPIEPTEAAPPSANFRGWEAMLSTS